jgi:CRP/FNR family cyclic AMP-dependent transcriptional regulator
MRCRRTKKFLEARPSDGLVDEFFDLAGAVVQTCFMQETAEVVKETYKLGDYIFFEGDLDSHFYIVQQGQVEIFTKNKTGQRISIAMVTAGESFGEFALLDKQARSATAQAATECVLIKVSEKGYEQLLAELPEWASSMMRSFASRLKSMNEKLKTIPQFIKK